MKNRDGKPTEFQLKTLKALGYNGKIRSYRDAENAIRRLRKAKKAVKPSCSCKLSCKKPIEGTDTTKVRLPQDAEGAANHILNKMEVARLIQFDNEMRRIARNMSSLVAGFLGNFA